MSDKTLNSKIQLKRDNNNNWVNNNPILLLGEFGYDITNNLVKIGDGITNWNSLSGMNVSYDIVNFTVANSLETINSGDTLATIVSKIAFTIDSYIDHINDTDIHVTTEEKNIWNNSYVPYTGATSNVDLGEHGFISTNLTVNGLADFTGSVAINTNPDNNTSGFEYGNGFNPYLYSTNYENESFRVNSFLETPFFSAGVGQNYLLQTESFDSTSWVKTGIGTVTANNVIAPNGLTVAENIPAGSDGTSNIKQTVTYTTTGYWSAGVWARMQNGTGTFKMRLDSASETGDEHEFEIDTIWRFFSFKQNFTVAGTNRVLIITNGTTPISLWGARLNTGEIVNAYSTRTTSALTSKTGGVFFNTTIYGTLSGNATSATSATSSTYSNYTTGGSYGAFTLSNLSDNTNTWELIGYLTLTYNSTYSYGQSVDQWLNLSEYSQLNSDVSVNDYENFDIQLKVNNPSASANSTTFNTNIPTININVRGKTNLSGSDLCALVYSTSTSSKIIRLYVKLKTSNKHYIVSSLTYGNLSYSSSGTPSTSYTSWTSSSSTAVISTLPTPVQGNVVYADMVRTEDSNGGLSISGSLKQGSVISSLIKANEYGELGYAIENVDYITPIYLSNNYQPLDGDLTSIAGLSGTSGFLKKTATNTWTLDTNTYLTSLSGALLATGTITGATTQAQTFTNGIKLSNLSGGKALFIDIDQNLVESANIAIDDYNITLTDGYIAGYKGGSSSIRGVIQPNILEAFHLVNYNLMLLSGYQGIDFRVADVTKMLLNVNGQLEMMNTTGSPFIVSSSTIVNNLNVQYLEGHDSSYFQPYHSNLLSLSLLSTTSIGFIKLVNGVASLDTNTYLTSITSAQITTALGYTPYNVTNPNGYTTNTGTVTSVAMTVPTGLTISGSPVTTSGTLALTLTSGYSIPTTANQTNWSTAYTFTSNYATNYPDLTAIEVLSGTSGFLKKTAANTWTLDTNTYLTSYINNYLTNVTGSGNGTITFARNGLTDLTFDASHTHAFSVLTGTVSNSQLANSSMTIAGNTVSLGGSLTTSILQSSLGLGSNAYTSYQNILERSYSGAISISSSGWYRIGEFLQSNVYGDNVILEIHRNFANSNNEAYIFSISMKYGGGINISQLSGNYGTRSIEKIRVDYTTGGMSYIDMYINTSVSNSYYWSTSFGAKSYTTATLISTPTGSTYEFSTVNGFKNDYITGSLTGNSSTATILQTSRTIWGQSFDGSANISGALTGATTGTFSSTVTVGNLINSGLTSGYVPYANSSKQLTNSPIYTNGTNVGIGTTSQSYTLDVKSIATSVPTLRLTGLDLNNGIRIDSSSSQTSNRNWFIGTNVYSYGDFTIKQSNDLSGDPLSAGSYKFYINSSGNVGIGTTSPSSRLTVPWLSGDTTTTFFVGSSDVNNNQVAVRGASYSYYGGYFSAITGHGVGGLSTSGYGVYGVSTNSYGVYGVSNNNNAVTGISTSGVGLRGLSTSYYGAYITSETGIAGYFSSTSGYGLIVASGNVGIGTTNPGVTLWNSQQQTAKLESAGGIRINSGSTASSGEIDSIQFAKYHNTLGSVYQYSLGEIRSFTTSGYAGGLRFYTSTGFSPDAMSAVMTLDSNGSVGIGTTSPSSSYKLDVSGDVHSTGTINTYDLNATNSITSALNIAASGRFYQSTNTLTSNLGSPSLAEMALFDEEFNNKTAFYDISKLRFYTTTDGSTWTEYTSFSDTDKRKLLGGDNNSSIMIPNGVVGFRIELTPSSYVYLNALYMYWSSLGNSTQVNIYKKNASTQVWSASTTTTNSISAWPGHMYLPFSSIPFNTGTNASYYDTIRIEFTPTWSSSNGISLYKMQIWGGYPAGKRNIYITDENGNVTFPAGVTSTGALTLSNLTSGYLPYANSSKQLTNSPIYTDGTNVMMGTTTSSGAVLDVVGTGNGFNGLTIGNSDPISWKNSTGLVKRLYLLTQADVSMIGPVDPGWGDFTYLSAGTSLLFRVNGSSGTFNTAMALSSDGKLGIGTTYPSYKLDVNGTARFVGNLYANANATITGTLGVTGNITSSGEVSFYTSSTRLLKDNINPITNAMNMLNKFNPVTFNWNEIALSLNSAKDKRNQFGVIAEELETVTPELVHGIYGNKYKSVDYVQMIPITIAGLKEHDVIITKQEKIIKEQSKQINDLYEQINILKKLINEL